MTEPVKKAPRKRAPAKKIAPPVEPDPVIEEPVDEVVPGVIAEVPPHDKKVLTQPTYEIVKKSVQIGLPALATFYAALSQIWGLPAADKVVATVVALNLFLGVILSISQRRWNESEARFDGKIEIEEIDGHKVASMVVSGDPEELLATKNEMTFKIEK